MVFWCIIAHRSKSHRRARWREGHLHIGQSLTDEESMEAEAARLPTGAVVTRDSTRWCALDVGRRHVFVKRMRGGTFGLCMHAAPKSKVR
jgi:hypothetical protein